MDSDFLWDTFALFTIKVHYSIDKVTVQVKLYSRELLHNRALQDKDDGTKRKANYHFLSKEAFQS